MTNLPHDEYVAMKMLTRHRQLRKEMPNKPHPDIEWMLGLLDVARRYDKIKEVEDDFLS